MGFIDSSVTAIAMPAIRTALDVALMQAKWINVAYPITLSGLVLAGGAMGDRFGTARVFGLHRLRLRFGPDPDDRSPGR